MDGRKKGIRDFILISGEFLEKLGKGRLSEDTIYKLIDISQKSFVFIENTEKRENRKIADELSKKIRLLTFPFSISEEEFLNFFGTNRAKIIKDERDLDKFENEYVDFDIPLLDPKREFAFFSDEIKKALFKTFSSGKFILGDEVVEFERLCAEYLGVSHTVGVASGTDALVLSLRAISYVRYGKEFFDKDDLIITTPFTFVATAEAILRAGAKPLFVDIDEETFNISPNEIEKSIKKYGKRVKGIVVVHIFGHSAEMDKITEIAEENEIFIVEDCAQAFGGEFVYQSGKRKKLGSIGDAGAFSFFPSKNLGGFGDGGLISTNNEKIAEVVKILRNHGGKDKYNAVMLGFNSRLDSIQAGLLLGKLQKLEELNEKRRKIAQTYKNLMKSEKIKLPTEKKYARHVYHQFTIYVKDGEKAREELKSLLGKNGISSAVYYPILLQDMQVFKGRCEVFGDTEVARDVTKKVLSIPIHPFLRYDEVEFVANVINSF